MKKILAVVLVLCLIALVAGAAFLMNRDEAIEGAGISPNAPSGKLTFRGTEYPMKRHLQTVLLIGTDSTEEYEALDEKDRDFQNYHQADFLLLLVVDKDNEAIELIQMNRDTMTNVPWLDVFGKQGGTEYKQLCLAFNYGDGGAVSCRNTVNAVSSLIFDAPIDSYIQIPMTAIPILNDLVGGVPVTITDDMTKIDPAFVKGATVRLTGAQAEKFVRARGGLEDDTNLARMRRQRDYMESFRNCAQEAIGKDSEFAVRLLDKFGKYLQSNMTVQQLSDLMEQMSTYRTSQIHHAEGDLKVGARYYEFYVDENSLWEIVKGAYC